MSERGKITAVHMRRAAVVYVRQSSASQLERNRESTDRQYALTDRAVQLGWPRSAVRVVDADLGISGASAAGRSGFGELTAQVALGQVGIVLALEVSRLARNNSDWYRLLDLAGSCDTLIGDADGVYHPAMFNDRMLLGLKGTMSEAELHVLRARLDGGIRNKAARGELRRGLPVGLVWGEADGEILLHPDETVRGVIAAIFDRFAACGSARGTWLWLRELGLKFPLHQHGYLTGVAEITWVEPTYHAVHNVLTHPGYAGAYTYGALPAGTPRRRGRHASPAAPHAAPRSVGGAHHRPPPGVHRLGHLPGQPGPHRRQHPPAGAPAGHRRGPGRVRAAAGAGNLRDLRPQARRLLRRAAQVHPRLLLHRNRPPGRRPGHPAPARRRCRDRHRRRRVLPGSARPRRAAGLPGRRPAARRGSRHRACPTPPPGRTSPLRHNQGRTGPPRGRSPQDPHRPRAGRHPRPRRRP